jgi:hypothetical protein
MAKTAPRLTRQAAKSQREDVQIVEVTTSSVQARSQSRQKRTGSSQPRKKIPVARKRATKHATPREHEQEGEEEELTQADGEQRYKSRRFDVIDLIISGQATRARRSRNARALTRELEDEITQLVDKLKDTPRGLSRLTQEIQKAVPAANEGEESEEDDPVEFIRHHKKDKIGPKERKKPAPWTPEEEAVLINSVCKFGPQWSKIETLYGTGRLFGRNQTALKDKARNIMRKIIDNDEEEEWIKRFPNWAQVTVGQARRGVHGYETGKVPDKTSKRSYIEMHDE